MSIENLTRIADLKNERDDLEEQIERIDDRIRQLIGQGFEIPGVARVKPFKAYKGKSEPGILDAALEEAKPKEDKPPAATIAATMLDAMAKQQLKAWTAPEMTAHLAKLGVAYKLQWVASGFYWLGQAGKLDRLGQGLYRFRKAA